VSDAPALHVHQHSLNTIILITSSEFKLTHDHAVGITQSDIETLASNWPSLETFTLACQPTELATPSTLTLLALLPFARHCSAIRSLGLFINASGTESSPLTSPSFARVGAAKHNIKRFKKLTTLSVGVSHIEDEGAVALFLSRLCPLGC